ncbi:MAG: biosynthetic-type acetolactate synthase large subunit [Deltaproteobacteria bacterium]
MEMTGARAIIKALEMENVDIIFGYPGAAICPVYDELPDSKIRHILVRQEQGAAHMASGYWRVTGKTGVCITTSGPGATNLITGIATAYMDSVPMVAITGQVSSELIGKDVFQEVDITGATAPFCKHSYLVKKVEDLPRIIKEAFHIASTGRPGPVIIDVPIDIQLKDFDFEYPQSVDIRGYKPNFKGHSLQIKKIIDALEKAKRPMICAGGGVLAANAAEELKLFAEKASVPVANTLMGKGSMPFSHELYLGMIGSHGIYAANRAMVKADFLLILGARAGDRAMGTNYEFAKDTVVVHIDIDPAEIGKNIGVDIPVVGDVKLILNELIRLIAQRRNDEWISQINEWKNEKPLRDIMRDINGGNGEYVKPQYVLTKLSELAGENAVVATEVGQNQIWAANYYKTIKANTFITSGGLGTMGYGLPAAIGAKFGKPDTTVIVIAGDGSFQMDMQELGTIKQNNLGIKIVLFNNQRLGMVRELQKIKYRERYSQVELNANPDFVKLVSAYGFNGIKVETNDGVEEALKEMLKSDSTFIVEFMVNPEEDTL